MNTEKLAYWINERDRIRVNKEAGEPKPWSEDKIFQTTYFCNVRREDDKVTKWIRENYTPEYFEDKYEWVICAARWINWPESLERIKYALQKGDSKEAIWQLERRATLGKKVWGNAYVVTTHGRKMPKLDWLLEQLEATIDWGQWGRLGTTLETAHGTLKQLNGFSDFMAGQVVADLKNTKGHYLENADDWYTWAAPGPGSMRGMNWVMEKNVTPKEFLPNLHLIYDSIEKSIPYEICYQDLQNCLCEYDKYCRVESGSGRSKRNYAGS